jgi:hypothetical protein
VLRAGEPEFAGRNFSFERFMDGEPQVSNLHSALAKMHRKILKHKGSENQMVGPEGGQPIQNYAIKSTLYLIMLEPMLEPPLATPAILNPGAKP